MSRFSTSSEVKLQELENYLDQNAFVGGCQPS
jgi:hypothetical protein